jgi:hypothetical protein
MSANEQSRRLFPPANQGAFINPQDMNIDKAVVDCGVTRGQVRGVLQSAMLAACAPSPGTK